MLDLLMAPRDRVAHAVAGEARTRSAPDAVSTTLYSPAPASRDAPALVGADSDLIVTFGELRDRADRIAAALIALGLRAGDAVATALPNCPELWEVITAGLQIGLRIVPLSTAQLPREAAWTLNDCGAVAIVAAPSVADIIDGLDVPSLRVRITLETCPGWMSLAALRQSDTRLPDDARVAGILMHYTAGTTGTPKGVLRPLPQSDPASVAARFSQTFEEAFQLPPTGVALSFGPPHHASPLSFGWAMLNAGYRLVLMEHFQPDAVLDAIERHRITVLNAVPTHLFRLVHSASHPRDLSSLEAVLVAGAPFSPQLRARATARFGEIIWEYYASTEGFVCAISPTEAARHPGSVGRPHNVIITDDDGTPVGANVPGLVWFHEAEPARFVYTSITRPVLGSGAPYATCGDIGMLDNEGYLRLVGRRADLLVSGGVNVSPAATEHVLRAAPGVADAMVVGVPDAEWGDRVVALVLQDAADPRSAATLDRFCRVNLSPAQRPRAVLFVDDLPLTPAGKPDRRRGREIAITHLASNAWRLSSPSTLNGAR